MRKGFTLIELLAVIVILAIIALIAIPIVIHIIDDSKKSSEKESIKLYTDTVEKTITKKQMSDPNFQPDKCDIKDKGNLECFKGSTSLGIVEIEMKGDVPSSGTVIIEGNNITYENIVLNSKTYYEKETPSFEIGDKITYKGSNWYVIKNSPSNQDYVTLLKEKVLTNEELGEYAQASNYIMSYYWSDQCHYPGAVYGTDTYNSYDGSGCNEHNDYEGSKIRQSLEQYIVNKAITNDLVSINNYKIRLITDDELKLDLGYKEQEKTVPWSSTPVILTTYTQYTPQFVYLGYGENQNGIDNGFWTMSSDNNNTSNVFIINLNGEISASSVNSFASVRPVINLLKSAIPIQ